MTTEYKPYNRRLCLPPVVHFHVDGQAFYMDDAQESARGLISLAWGMIGNPVHVIRHHTGRYTLCDARGRYLRRAQAQRGEYQRRVHTFATPEDAARHLVRTRIEECN